MDLKVLVDCKLIMNQQCEAAFEKGLHLKVASVEAKCPKQGRWKSTWSTLKCLVLSIAFEERYWQNIKKQRLDFANKGPSSQSYGFSRSHVWMWELDYKESWAPKNWCFWTVVLEKTLESPLDCKQIQPVHPKGNQPWIFIGRTGAEAETPILGPPFEELAHWKRPGCWERLKAGREGMTVDEMVGWHHQIDGHEFEQAQGVGAGQGSLACCSPCGCKESDMTEWLNWLTK